MTDESMLGRIRAEWARKGWDPADLQRFTMEDPPKDPPKNPPDPLTQLDTWAKSIGATEKHQGRTAALREVQEKLGMTPDEAVAFITAAKAKEREGLAEADRKLAEAADKETAATRLETSAREREMNAEVRATLIEAGVPRAQAKTVARLVDLDVKDWDEAKVTAAVDQLKKDMPALFAPPPPAEGTPPGAPTTPVHSAPGAPAPPPGTPTSADKARARLHERHPELITKKE